MNAAEWFRLGFLMDLCPPVAIVHRQISTYTRVRKTGATSDRHIGPYDYSVGISITQPLFPLATQTAQMDRARVEVRKAQAQYDQVRLDTETKLRGALSLLHETEASLRAATAELRESAHVLDLTESLYRSGRIDLDNVARARIDRGKAYADVQAMHSKNAAALWIAAHSWYPEAFQGLIYRQLRLQPQATSPGVNGVP